MLYHRMESVAAENSGPYLLHLMDHLWYGQLLLSKSNPPPKSQPFFIAAAPESDPLVDSSASNLSRRQLIHFVPSDDETRLLQYGHEKQQEAKKESTMATEREQQEIKKESTTPRERERLSRVDNMASKTRSQSPSPSTQKRCRSLTNDASVVRLEKSMSCKSLCELELEEVQGFMDLGFVFDKESMSKRMMSVLPGLQRLELSKKQEKSEAQNDDNVSGSAAPDDGTGIGFGIGIGEEEEKEKEEEEEKERKIKRPYLSEAWLIKRPDSPLLNLRIPKVDSAADLKKHLKYWAKTVASAIRKESFRDLTFWGTLYPPYHQKGNRHNRNSSAPTFPIC